jgi:microcystin-dependent protein
MSQPFLGEIKIISWNFAPKGWALCNGQFLPINQNQALFSLLGTSFGGNGQTTFALPDFRGRVPVHVGSNFNVMGQAGGQAFHTVTQSEMPQHLHFAQASNTLADQATLLTAPANTPNILAAVTGAQYANASSLTTLEPSSVNNVGGSQPHENRQPFTVLYFIIALVGIFPSRN